MLTVPRPAADYSLIGGAILTQSGEVSQRQPCGNINFAFKRCRQSPAAPPGIPGGANRQASPIPPSSQVNAAVIPDKFRPKPQGQSRNDTFVPDGGVTIRRGLEPHAARRITTKSGSFSAGRDRIRALRLPSRRITVPPSSWSAGWCCPASAAPLPSGRPASAAP